MADVELVIKIPEELLNKIDNENYQSVIWWYDTTLYCAITNGTPLPKGHGRLVDIDKVRTEFDWLEKVTNEGSIVEQAAYRKLIQCINVVNAAPTIIEADKVGEE